VSVPWMELHWKKKKPFVKRNLGPRRITTGRETGSPLKRGEGRSGRGDLKSGVEYSQGRAEGEEKRQHEKKTGMRD